MSTMFDDKLEPLAVQMAQIEPGMRVREVAEISAAISAKRQADALERIANAFDQQSGVGSVLHWLETIASAANAGVGR